MFIRINSKHHSMAPKAGLCHTISFSKLPLIIDFSVLYSTALMSYLTVAEYIMPLSAFLLCCPLRKLFFPTM